MTRIEPQNFSNPDKRILSPEQKGLLRRKHRLVDKILDNPDLCAWIRRAYVQERKTIDAVLAVFLSDPWAQDQYEHEGENTNVTQAALVTLRYELLTPKEIIELNKHNWKQGAPKIVEARGDVLWTEENLQILRGILAEPDAKREMPRRKLIAEEFSKRTDKKVSEEQIRNYLRRQERYALADPQESELYQKRSGKASAEARGGLLSNPENDRIMAEIMEKKEARRTILRGNYIAGRFAELTGKAASWDAIRSVINDRGLFKTSEDTGEE